MKEIGNSIVSTQNGGFIIGGYTTSYYAGQVNAWIMLINETGDTLWSKTYGVIGNTF